MTEETPQKKPRKKRRTKAQIAAEKEKAVEIEFGSSYEKEIDELIAEKEVDEKRCIPCEEKAAVALAKAEADIEAERQSLLIAEAEKEVVEPAPKPVYEPETLPDYIPKTGLAKLRMKIEQRKLKERHSQQRKSRNE